MQAAAQRKGDFVSLCYETPSFVAVIHKNLFFMLLWVGWAQLGGFVYVCFVLFFFLVLLRVLHGAAVRDMARGGSHVRGLSTRCWLGLALAWPLTIQQSSSGFLTGLQEPCKEAKNTARPLKAQP